MIKTLINILLILILEFHLFGQVDTLFWINGNIREIQSYSSVDRYDIMAYHPNGKLHYKGNAKLWSNLEYRPNIEDAYDINGNQTIENGNGILYSYFVDLKPQSISKFKNHHLIGDYEEYFQNGQLKIKGNYGSSNGQYPNYKQDIWQFYNEKGTLCEEREYVNGNEYYLNFWYNGKQILKDGKGQLKLFYDSGKLKSQGTIKDSKKWGNWVEYSPNSEILNKIRYSKWNGNYSSQINFKLILLSSFDTSQISIGKNGSGYILMFRNNGTLEMKKHLTSNSVDSIITYYKNGEIFRKIRVDSWNETTLETFYSNAVLESQRINENESKYWDWNGSLSCEIKQSDFDDISNSYKETTIRYFSNGSRKEIEECIITYVINESGEELFEYDCQSKYWDEQGNEINKP